MGFDALQKRPGLAVGLRRLQEFQLGFNVWHVRDSLETDPPAFSGAGGGGRSPGSVCQADTSGDAPIRLGVKHQDLAQLLEPPSSVLLRIALAIPRKHTHNLTFVGLDSLRIVN